MCPILSCVECGEFGEDQSGPAILHCVGAVQTTGDRTDCV